MCRHGSERSVVIRCGPLYLNAGFQSCTAGEHARGNWVFLAQVCIRFALDFHCVSNILNIALDSLNYIQFYVSSYIMYKTLVDYSNNSWEIHNNEPIHILIIQNTRGSAQIKVCEQVTWQQTKDSFLVWLVKLMWMNFCNFVIVWFWEICLYISKNINRALTLFIIWVIVSMITVYFYLVALWSNNLTMYILGFIAHLCRWETVFPAELCAAKMPAGVFCLPRERGPI